MRGFKDVPRKGSRRPQDDPRGGEGAGGPREPGTAPRGSQGPPRPFDVTRQDARVTITSPREGNEAKTFVVYTQPQNATFAPGERVVARLREGGFRQGFAFADAFGVNVWGRYQAAPGAKKSQWEWYADMLSRPSHYQAKGYRYEIDRP
jgi:hypothetical protein